MMNYKVCLVKGAKEDYQSLDGAIRKQARAQLQKLKASPQLGRPLGQKRGLDLTGYLSLHFYKNKYRIVYKIDEDKRRVIVIGIGPRESLEVYKEGAKRKKD